MHRHELLERAFDDPITLSDGTELLTLRDAISWLAKKVPKARHNDPDIQLAARLVTDAAENGGILMMAEIAMRRASRSGMEQRDEDG
jgi:hypothetical protein